MLKKEESLREVSTLKRPLYCLIYFITYPFLNEFLYLLPSIKVDLELILQVHERDSMTDIILVLLKELLPKRNDLKVEYNYNYKKHILLKSKRGHLIYML